MTIRSFKCFVAVCEHPTLSSAADALYISQPGLSQQIKNIEKEVGVSLFHRKGHNMTLTPAGESFLLCSRRVLQFYDAMLREISTPNSVSQDTVCMGISSFYSQHYLPKVLPQFLRNHPNIHVDIVEDLSANLESKLVKGEMDFCLLPLSPKNEMLEYETIYHEEILLAVPREHPMNTNYPEDAISTRTYPPIDLKLMKNEPFISLKRQQKFSAIALRLCEEAGFLPNTVCETTNWETVHMMISSGLGIGFVPEMLIGSVTDPELCPCYYQLSSPVYRDYGLAHRPGTVFSDSAKKLLTSLRIFFHGL